MSIPVLFLVLTHDADLNVANFEERIIEECVSSFGILG